MIELSNKEKVIKETIAMRMLSPQAVYKSEIAPYFLSNQLDELTLKQPIHYYYLFTEEPTHVYSPIIVFNRHTRELFIKSQEDGKEYRLIEGLIDYADLYHKTIDTIRNYVEDDHTTGNNYDGATVIL